MSLSLGTVLVILMRWVVMGAGCGSALLCGEQGCILRIPTAPGKPGNLTISWQNHEFYHLEKIKWKKSMELYIGCIYIFQFH